ncbi:MAG: TIGR04076 family protein [Candidatus Heimdallarchaeaceae archaeon]
MSKIKVSVIKRINPDDIFEGGIKHPKGDLIKTCTIFSDGDEFIIENLNKPEKFCGWAWRDIYKDLSVLNFGGDFSWSEPGVAITCCTDGMRPVIFKLERMSD